ncbi:MAG: hypothetical protein IPM18_17215 [Phycisphaerales bacterium]|nr:hypothetical protein [Phycisphaerales bacterium]
MSIEFHCSHCGKMIKTSNDAAGGKRGKCPFCHNTVYIPMAEAEVEPLRLAPSDETAERTRQQLEEDARLLARTLRSETDDVPDLAPRQAFPVSDNDARLPSDVETLVIEYVLSMADGRLDEAEQLAEEIRREPERAAEVVQRLTMDELPPKRLARVPRPLIQGFVKQLHV